MTAGVRSPSTRADFGSVVAARHRARGLVVQPRMGMAEPDRMRAALLATKAAAAPTVGTITLDSYTRTGDHAQAALALRTGTALNGYPLVAHGPDTTRRMLDGVADRHFPVQVRHGSAAPAGIFAACLDAGLTASEGGPVSYCLPYSRLPLRTAVRNWEQGCQLFAAARGDGVEPHLESFGGCLLGQLCPPGLLVAISVLEAMFFRQHGIRSVSLSYAQQLSPAQDHEAVTALRVLAGELLPDVQWHVVVYAYMGVFPRTPEGCRGLLVEAVRLAVRGGAERLIVKTVAEAHRIPTVAENVEALEFAAAAAGTGDLLRPVAACSQAGEPGVYAEARTLIEAVLALDDDLGIGLVRAFALGILDIPYCLHQDNRNAARSCLDEQGRLRWAEVGAMPIRAWHRREAVQRLDSTGLLIALDIMRRRYDQPDDPDEWSAR